MEYPLLLRLSDAHLSAQLRDSLLAPASPAAATAVGSTGAGAETGPKKAETVAGGGAVYELSSVVMHHGRSLAAGHYSAFCREAHTGRVSWHPAHPHVEPSHTEPHMQCIKHVVCMSQRFIYNALSLSICASS